MSRRFHHTFCACGHLGWRHHDAAPHACASPRCDCEGWHIPVRRHDHQRDSTLPQVTHADPRRRRLGHALGHGPGVDPLER